MTALPHQFEELADLVWALANDRLDAAGGSRLCRLLDDDAVNRRVYIELMDQFASLEWERAEGKRAEREEGRGDSEKVKGWALQCPVEKQGPVGCPIDSPVEFPKAIENQNRSVCFSVHPITIL